MGTLEHFARLEGDHRKSRDERVQAARLSVRSQVLLERGPRCELMK